MKERVASVRLRWLQRAVVRKWPDSPDDDSAVRIVALRAEYSDESETSGDASEDGALVTERLILVEGDADHGCVVGLRGSIYLDDARMMCLQEAEVRVGLDGADIPSDEDLADFLRGWGHQYLLGFLRGGVTDSASSVGLSGIVISPLAELGDEGVEGLIVSARETASSASTDD